MINEALAQPKSRPMDLQRPSYPSAALLFPLFVAAVALSHLTLLHLPYFWDEGGYYVPAAYDFYRSGTLIPEFTNAHPPLPSVVLGSLWHLFGFSILVTRLTACFFAAGGLLAVFALARRLLGTGAAVGVASLTALYPIWFAQSSLAHADIFASAFTLGGLALYLTSPELTGAASGVLSSNRRIYWAAALFCLSVLSKETAIVQPAVLFAIELYAVATASDASAAFRRRLRWICSLCTPIPVLVAWYAYHYSRTGFIFGNPAFLRYNATGNLSLDRLLSSVRYRFIHLFWQRNIWVPIALALACLLLPRRSDGSLPTLPAAVVRCIAALLLANALAFSVLGGALLTRYLLPVYPLILLLCMAQWQERTRHWRLLAALSGVAFFAALWWNPQTFFAPEDNLTYRDMILVQQQAIAFLQQQYPDATVLTAWPVSAELFRPELGYTTHRFQVYSIENFTVPQLTASAEHPDRYDTALVFTTHYTSPAFRQYLLTHPQSWRGRRYTADLDLTPAEIAAFLGGKVVWQADRNGEWAAVLRFSRSYQACVRCDQLISSSQSISGGKAASTLLSASSSRFRYNHASTPGR